MAASVKPELERSAAGGARHETASMVARRGRRATASVSLAQTEEEEEGPVVYRHWCAAWEGGEWE